MNERGANSLLHSKVKLGGDLSVAAGPVGRSDRSGYGRLFAVGSSYLLSLPVACLRGCRSKAPLCAPTMRVTQALYGRKVNANEHRFGSRTGDACCLLIS